MSAKLDIEIQQWLTKHTHDVSSYINDGIASGITKATSIRSSVMSNIDSCSEHGVQTNDNELSTLDSNIGKLAGVLSQRIQFDSFVTYTINVPKYLRTSVDDTANVLIDKFNLSNRTVERLLAAMSNEISCTLSRKSILCDPNVDITSLVHTIVNEHQQIIQHVYSIDTDILTSIRDRVIAEYQTKHQ